MALLRNLSELTWNIPHTYDYKTRLQTISRATKFKALTVQLLLLIVLLGLLKVLWPEEGGTEPFLEPEEEGMDRLAAVDSTVAAEQHIPGVLAEERSAVLKLWLQTAGILWQALPR